MQKNVREIAVLMQDKEKEYKICEKLRRQPELSDLKILCREQLQSLGPSETFNKRLKRLQPLAGRVLLTDLQDTELPEVVKIFRQSVTALITGVVQNMSWKIPIQSTKCTWKPFIADITDFPLRLQKPTG